MHEEEFIGEVGSYEHVRTHEAKFILLVKNSQIGYLGLIMENIEGIPLYHLELVRDYSIPVKSIRKEFIYDMLHKLLDHSLIEQLVVVYVDPQDKLLGVERAAIGTTTMVAVTMQEVFRGAILAGADAIIVSHNHPSAANAKPSDQDLILTSVILECSKILGVHLLDHIIVAPNGTHYSMFENVEYMRSRLNDIKFGQAINNAMRFLPPPLSPIHGRPSNIL